MPSVICRVVVSLYKIITITLNFLCFIGVWKHHWENKAVSIIEPGLVLHFAVCFIKLCYKELLKVKQLSSCGSPSELPTSERKTPFLFLQRWCKQCKKEICYALGHFSPRAYVIHNWKRSGHYSIDDVMCIHCTDHMLSSEHFLHFRQLQR